MDPYLGTSKFVELLNSQQTVSFGTFADSVDVETDVEESNLDGESVKDRKARRTWTPTDDVVLISSWLNTSKDLVVANDQRADGFWKRIAAYFAASPLVASCEVREPAHCKHRWHKINEQVSKFCGAYEAAVRERSSGQNENDVVKHAHQIFYNNYTKRFTLEHAWKELRHDQKWCELATAKEGNSKKRNCEEGGDSESSQATEKKRPPGVKAAKKASQANQKKVVEEETFNKFENMFAMKQVDLAGKDRLSQLAVLNTLFAKEGPLPEYEETLKKKLIKDLWS